MDPTAATPTATFDPVAFERTLTQKVHEQPELGGPLTAALIIMIGVALTGIGLLLQEWRTRKDRPPPPGPAEMPSWGAAGALGMFLLAQLNGFIMIRIASGGERIQDLLERAPARLIVASMTASGLMAALAFLVAAARAQRPRALGFAPGKDGLAATLREAARFLVMAFPVYYTALFASKQLFDALGWRRPPNPAARIFVTTDSPGELALIAVVAIVLAPILEEIIFRGFIFGGLRRRFGGWAAAVASAILFAVVHPPIDWAAIFILGCALALAYERTGSIYAPIFMHVLNNSLGIAMLAAQRYVYKA